MTQQQKQQKSAKPGVTVRFGDEGVQVGERFVMAGTVTFRGADWSTVDVVVELGVADDAPHVRVVRLEVLARAGGALRVSDLSRADGAHLGEAVHRATAALSWRVTGPLADGAAVRPAPLPLARFGLAGERVVPRRHEADLLRRQRSTAAQGPSDATLRRVATLYRRAMREGVRGPSRAVWEALAAEGESASRATVRTWVAKARERGFLGPVE